MEWSAIRHSPFTRPAASLFSQASVSAPLHDFCFQSGLMPVNLSVERYLHTHVYTYILVSQHYPASGLNDLELLWRLQLERWKKNGNLLNSVDMLRIINID